MYSANQTPGTRPQASTFSALPGGGVDNDRFGQFIFRFDTAAAGIPSGRGLSGYTINSLKVTARIGQDKLFRYDASADESSTYGASPLAPDTDIGRPLEIHGTAFRNGFTPSTFLETSSYSGGTPRTRNAYALGFDPSGTPRDVSSNVTEGFDAMPWAVGHMSSLVVGDLVPVDTVVSFDINLGLPGVRQYVSEGLDAGFIWFTLSSLHPALQQGGEFVSYYTRDSTEHQLFGDSAPSFAINYTLDSIPEPSSAMLCAAMAALALTRRRRR